MTEADYMNQDFQQSENNSGFMGNTSNQKNMDFGDFNAVSYEGSQDEAHKSGTSSNFPEQQQQQQQPYYSFNPSLYTPVDEQQHQATMNSSQNSFFPYTHSLQPYMWMQPQHFGYIPHPYQQHLANTPYYCDNNSQYNYQKNYLQRNQSGQANDVGNTQRKDSFNDISPLSPKFNQQQTQSYNGNYMTQTYDSNSPYTNDVKTTYQPHQQKLYRDSLAKPVNSIVPRSGGIYGISLSDEERDDLLVFLKQRKSHTLNNLHIDAKNKLRGLKSKHDHLWSEDICFALNAAVTCIPKDDFNRIRLSTKQYGRNELISMYIYVSTGEKRKIKQISSHLQVWKKRLTRDLKKTAEIMKSKKIGKYHSKKQVKLEGEEEELNAESSDKQETNHEPSLYKATSNVDIIDLETGEVVFERHHKREETLSMKESQRLLSDFNTKMFMSKNGLESNEDIVYFHKMTTLIYNLLEYGIVKSDVSMLRFKEIFLEVEQKLAKGSIDKI